MEKWLNDNFEIVKNDEGKEKIVWYRNNNLKARTGKQTIINKFGEVEEITKENLLEKTENDGDIFIVESWDKMGVFDN